MSDPQLYCTAPGCDDPENPGFPRPVGGHGFDVCSSHRKQLQRVGKTTPIAEKLNPEERAIEAGTKMLEAEDDAEYAKHRRAWLVACRALGERERAMALKKAFAAAKRRGVRLGRPPKVTTEQVMRELRTHGNTRLVAAALGITRRTVFRHLRRADDATRNCVTTERPRRAG